MTNENREKCGYGCGRFWNEEGDKNGFEDCVSAYHKKENKNIYDHFVKLGRNVGFTDDQIDFLWECFYVASTTPESFTHDDNYKK